MRSTEAICLALWLALCSSATVKGQNEPSLSARIRKALTAAEPEWTPVPAIVNGPGPRVPSEKRILTDVWESPKSQSENMTVDVYGVENRVEATAWLRFVRNRQVAPGWQVSIYQIGDEGYLSKYKDGERFDIQFRKGNVVAEMAGNDLRRVKTFAKCTVDQIPANHRGHLSRLQPPVRTPQNGHRLASNVRKSEVTLVGGGEE